MNSPSRWNSSTAARICSEKVEEALAEQGTGFHAVLHLEPEHAFGDYDPALVFFESNADPPEGMEVGMQFDGPPPGAKTPGMPASAIYTVTEVHPEHVVLDGNHPLAGIALRLDLTVRDVREASEEEIEAGSVGSSAFTVLNTAPPDTRCTDTEARFDHSARHRRARGRSGKGRAGCPRRFDEPVG